MENEKLLSLLAKSLQYTPIVYRQSLYRTNQNVFENIFVLEFKHSDIPDDSLLFFIPAINSLGGSDCKLLIRFPSPNGWVEKEYTLYVEENDSSMRKAGKNDLIAYRMCIIRFQKSLSKAIVCNSPLFQDAIFNTLKVSRCEFINRPVIQDPNDPDTTYTLVDSNEFSKLEERVRKLENKIIFGTAEPEEVLADCPTGTIYIRHEED